MVSRYGDNTDQLNEKKEMTVNRQGGLGRVGSRSSFEIFDSKFVSKEHSLLLRVSICGVAREKYLTGQLCMHWLASRGRSVVRLSKYRASNPLSQCPKSAPESVRAGHAVFHGDKGHSSVGCVRKRAFRRQRRRKTTKSVASCRVRNIHVVLVCSISLPSGLVEFWLRL